MNTYLFSRRGLTARFYAVVTIVSLLFTAFPAAFFVAEAATSSNLTLEVFANPVGTDGDLEYISLQNNGPDDLNFTNWKFDENGVQITLNGILPNGNTAYACANDDSSQNGGRTCAWEFPSGFGLTNTGGTIKLLDDSDVEVLVAIWGNVNSESNAASASVSGTYPLAAPACTPQYDTGNTSDPVSNPNTGEYFTSIQDALDDCDTADGDTIHLHDNVHITERINVHRPATIEGNGYTIFSEFEKTSNSNNSAIGVGSDNVTIKNVNLENTHVSSDWRKWLHGINVYISTGIVVENVLLDGFLTGLVVNGSSVSATDVTTRNNLWHGINVDQGSGVTEPAILDIYSTSEHSENSPVPPSSFVDGVHTSHIFIDDVTADATVNDWDDQYDMAEVDFRGGRAEVYTLKRDVEPPDNSCLIPDDLGDDEDFKIGVPPGPEKGVQLIFNETGYGSVDAEDDQINTQVWDVASSDTATVDLKITLLGSYAGNNQLFGYYEAGDDSSFVPVFTVGAHSNSAPALAPGASMNITVPNNVAESIGFALDTEGKAPDVWFSEFDLNLNDQDNLAVYNPADNTYLLAFEDLPDGHGDYDNDHNDLVVKVEVLRCNEESDYGTINVCKIIVDENGDISDGDFADAEFSVDLAGPASFDETVTFTTALTLNTDLVNDNDDALDAECVILDTLKPGEYTYEAEEIFSNANWADPLYHDYFDEVPSSVADFYALTVDGQPDDEDNADGVINLAAGQERTLAIVNAPEAPICEPERYVFADSVEDDDQGLTKNGAAVAAGRSNPEDAIGDPDWSVGVETGFFSLGFGGWIEVSFEKYVVNVEGDDLSIHEATNSTSYSLETAKVEVSQDGDKWYELSEEARNDNDEGGDGVTLLDFDETGLDWIRYVRVTDTTDALLHNGNADGFDLDTVDATYVVCDEPEPDPEIVVVHTYKVVCTDEADLPNWNTNQNGAPKITGDTAADWVAEHDSCELVRGWEFEWAPKGTGDPGDTLIGPAGGNWTTFTGTTNILLADLNNKDDFWMREVLQEGYIPFTHGPEGNKNTDDVTAEFYCHIDGLNYDNYDRVDNVEADGEYYCVAWNAPTEPPIVYGDYCGDNVRQGWEQCDGTDTMQGYQCADTCLFANQCSAEQLIKITFDPNAPESESFDGEIYLGSASNPIPSSTWFNFNETGDDVMTAIANAADGLAVERTGTELRLAVKGGNSQTRFDYVFGSIETLGIDLGAIDRSPVPGWPLENGGEYPDIFDKVPTEAVDFKFWLTHGDDAVTVEIGVGEEHGYCPECDAEVEARIVLQDGEEILQNGDGNLLPQVILGDGTIVPFGDWFKLSEAPGVGQDAEWIDDDETVTAFTDPETREGLFVSREGDGTVKVALYGFHQPGGDTNYESLRATIEFNDAKIKAGETKQIPGNYQLENHSESDGVSSNDNFDSFTKADDLMSVDFDFWVDTAADGITITLDEDEVAICDDDTDPKDPGDPDPIKYTIDGTKFQTTGDATTTYAGWTIELRNGDGVFLTSTTTDDNGSYYFEVVAGSYQVHEVLPTDWQQVLVVENGSDLPTDQGLQHCSFLIEDDLVVSISNQLTNGVYGDYACDFYNQFVEPVTPTGPTPTSNRSSNSGTRITLAAEPAVLGAATMCPFLEDYMQIGWENDRWEVTKLQLFLNAFRSVFGGTENPVTGSFDAATDANVKAFQAFYRNEVLIPWFTEGIVPHSDPTGFVYKTTLWKINDLVCPDFATFPDFEGETLESNVDLD